MTKLYCRLIVIALTIVAVVSVDVFLTLIFLLGYLLEEAQGQKRKRDLDEEEEEEDD